MAKAIKLFKYGSPQEFVLEDYHPGSPKKGEVLLAHEAIGLNYIDIYHRTGLYPLPSLPAVIGMEGAGVVEAVGENVAEFSIGDRVAYAGLPPGAYATQRLIPADRLVQLPEEISCQTAAAIMLKGMTARYLLYGCYHVVAEDRILIHAAAGGVGSLVCQWANHLGATVIGTVGNQEKAEIAIKNGCHHPIVYTQRDFVEQVKQITVGQGVDVVYDSVGKNTFEKSLNCLKPMGTMVSFGQSSGPVQAFDPALLAAKGSLFLTRPSLMTYTAKREDLLAHAADLFEMVLKGHLNVPIERTYPLSDVAQAHRDLESRVTSRSVILLPD